MRKIHLLIGLALWLGLCANLVQAANYKLTDGRTVTGEIIESGSNDATALIKVEDNKYERVPWGQFGQDDLKAFLAKYAGNKKIVEAVEPFIEITQEEVAAHTEVKIKEDPQLVKDLKADRKTPGGSVIGSLFQSGLGLFLVLLIYAANIYAGYEISIFRAQPGPLVVGLAAIPVLGFISNIVFVSLPTRVEHKTDEDLAFEAQEEVTSTIAIPGHEAAAAEAAAEAAPQGPRSEVFTRGKFTFNKRFFETKFAGFFGVVRREEDKAKALIFKTAKGQFTAQRITRITATEIYIQAERGGGASVETALQFSEIQEVVLQPHA